MLELLNQMDGFDARGDVKASPCSASHSLRDRVRLTAVCSSSDPSELLTRLLKPLQLLTAGRLRAILDAF